MLLEGMVARESVCLRRLGGSRTGEVRFGQLLANRRVTLARLLEGWSEQTGPAASGRHVLAIQDTSEINFPTKPGRRRGLGEIGKGNGRGVLLHAMVAVDAETGFCLGLVAGEIWTRPGRITVAHGKRALEEKESNRWPKTAQRAKAVLHRAARITVVADRESDIYAEWARLPEPNFDLLARVMHDRNLLDGSGLYAASESWPIAGTAEVDLRARERRRPEQRRAKLSLRYGRVTLKRPQNGGRGLPKGVCLTLVEVIELQPPAGAEPVHWRLLSTHAVSDAAAAWRIVGWYKQRWTIEQLFRLMKTQGLQLESSQVESADRLIKLTAIAAKAATVILQLVQARDAPGDEPASVAFTPRQEEALDVLNERVEGRTALQKNPYPRRSLRWATWIISRLGGWDGYRSSRKPGPITIRHGLQYFYAFAHGLKARDTGIP